MSGQSPTVSEISAPGESPREPDPPDAYHLVVAWSAEATARAGELLTLPGGAPGPWGVVGRGAGGDEDPHPRVLPARHRPGRIDSSTPFSDPHLSRVQLRARVCDGNGIEIERLGRAPLLQGGRDVQRAMVAPGETLQLGQRLLLLAVRRTAWIP